MALFTILATGAGVTSQAAVGAATGEALAMPATARTSWTIEDCMAGMYNCSIYSIVAKPVAERTFHIKALRERRLRI